MRVVKQNHTNMSISRSDRRALESGKLTFGQNDRNRPFPSSLKPLFLGESKCESFVMVISSAFHMSEN